MQKMFEVSQAGLTRIAGTVDLMVRYGREGRARSATHHDAYAAVRDVAALIGPSVARDLPIVLDLSGDGTVHCVPEELNQAISSLLQNALEAVLLSSNGAVTVVGRQEGSWLSLGFRDTGPGIPESERTRIFDAFYTTKQPGQNKGLGLTIARRVIVAAGGTLSLKSEPGRGSEFLMRVPSAVAREAVG